MRKEALLMVLMCCIVSSLSAQSTLKGRVVDENGDALVGANVWIEYTNIGTSTNEKGLSIVEQPSAEKHSLRATTEHFM